MGTSSSRRGDSSAIHRHKNKSTRDKTRYIQDLIKEVSAEHQGPAPLEMVLERAQSEMGMDRNKAEEIIGRLKRDGSIFEPKTGFLKLT